MSAPCSNPYAANRHADVLNEEPGDAAAKARLVEEIKYRAKGAFAQKDMPSAELLYGKAIKVLETTPRGAEAALYSNRAMVRLNLNKVDEALQDAIRCIEIDPKFVKAHHRKAHALLRRGDWDEAISAAEEGLSLEPGNAEFQELIDKARRDRETDAEDKAKLKRDAQDATVELHNASTARAPPQKKERKDRDGEEEVDTSMRKDRDGEEEVDTSMRGYKTTADGKKTSYFHTDISEEAKRLIEAQGFGKPKKLEAPMEEQAVRGGGSQWNQAGTYEEKGMTKWVADRLRAALVGVTLDLPGDAGGRIRSTAVESFSGDASVSISRGKRRRLMDLAFAVAFEGEVGSSSGRGRLHFSDVTAGEGDQPEVRAELSEDAPPALREVFGAFVRPAGQGLQPLLLARLAEVLTEFRQQ